MRAEQSSEIDSDDETAGGGKFAPKRRVRRARWAKRMAWHQCSACGRAPSQSPVEKWRSPRSLLLEASPFGTASTLSLALSCASVLPQMFLSCHGLNEPAHMPDVFASCCLHRAQSDLRDDASLATFHFRHRDHEYAVSVRRVC